jgi:hypothetical protein
MLDGASWDNEAEGNRTDVTVTPTRSGIDAVLSQCAEITSKG